MKSEVTYRYLRAKGIKCDVIAPSLVPEQPGKRVKTDRRDAKKLARLFRSGELTPVWVPDEDHEALRDLTRARQGAQEDVKRKQHQLQKLLLRLGHRPPEGVRAWTTKHRKWLESLKLPRTAQQIVLADYIHALDEATGRVDRLQREIEEQARASDHAWRIAAFQALRGIAVLTSTTLVAELGDLTRFPSARQAMDYVGLDCLPATRSIVALRVYGPAPAIPAIPTPGGFCCGATRGRPTSSGSLAADSITGHVDAVRGQSLVEQL